MSTVCLSRSLSADRELKADFKDVCTGERKQTEIEKNCHGNYVISKCIIKNPFGSHGSADSLLLASLQKSSCSRDTLVGESGDSGQTSWVFDPVVERLGLEAWRRGD